MRIAPMKLCKFAVAGARAFSSEPLRLGFAVALLHAEEEQQTGADRSSGRSVDLDGGFVDALNESDHRGEVTGSWDEAYREAENPED